MKKTRRALGLGFAVALTLMSLVACGQASASDPQAENVESVTVGTFADPNTIFLGTDEGLFDPLDLQTVFIDSGPAGLSLIKNGDLQVIGNAGGTVLGIALSRNLPLTAVWTNGDVEMKLVSKGLESAEDLRGKKVGTVQGTIAEFELSEYLKANGMAISDVEVVNIQAPSLAAALETDQIDAAFIWPPASGQLLAVPGATEMHSVMAGSWVLVENGLLESKPDAVQDLVCGFARSADKYHSDTDRAQEVIAAAIEAPKDLVAELLPIEFVATSDQQLEPRNLGDEAIEKNFKTSEWMYDGGQLDTPVSLEEIEAAFDPTFAEYAANGSCS